MEIHIAILITLIINSIANILCFLYGAKIGQAVVKGGKIETPTMPKPIEKLKEHKEKKEHELEQQKMQKILENIDNYPNNQVDVN
ncbi:hypothetical protein [uncultured Thomasclavelia sp.]|uniref:hypothetical protein n=1 Tax=uncultured Thomasclavelia sp. TaxID=3025759 RepID=UPI0025983A61|nr:hypothetical protein [uncultured Thomasclavelia sp.]